MKKSIILLITLILIVAISSLIAVGLHIVQSASKEVQQKKALVQIATFVHDIANILKQKSQDINSSDGLEILISLPIDFTSDEIEVHVSFDSAAKGINPNNFFKKEQNKTVLNYNYILLFDRILQTNNVQNKELFLALIEDSLDKDLDERIPGSEIALYDKRFAQGRIENFQKFMMLINHYVLLTEDSNIYTIPWKKILGFYNKKIDFNYISPKLLSYMLPYLDIESLKKLTIDKEMNYDDWKELPLAKEYKDELKKYDITFFVPVIQGKLRIKQGQERSSAIFIYNIKEKKVVDIGYKIN
ncbi:MULTISPECIES: hypothetical protein [unclassified Nitratiruptor]|uniref:hypothetical protein n=1 Tax=unclassified Nitratiruptor TaxID=2624044 RepID=UPI001915DB97|nr:MULTISPECIES: hypothetical protein [unclassified Nitratiruptor]